MVVKIFESEKVSEAHQLSAGTIVTDGKKYIKVAVPDGFVSVLSLQLPSAFPLPIFSLRLKIGRAVQPALPESSCFHSVPALPARSSYLQSLPNESGRNDGDIQNKAPLHNSGCPLPTLLRLWFEYDLFRNCICSLFLFQSINVFFCKVLIITGTRFVWQVSRVLPSLCWRIRRNALILLPQPRNIMYYDRFCQRESV